MIYNYVEYYHLHYEKEKCQPFFVVCPSSNYEVRLPSYTTAT